MKRYRWALLALVACRTLGTGAMPPSPREAPSVEAPRAAVAPEQAKSPDAHVDLPRSRPPASSPFHEAVIGYPDQDDAKLPNALVVCPFRGRTFICGVSDVPLLSTDEGVVNDESFKAGKGDGSDPLVWHPLTTGSWPDSAWMVGGFWTDISAYHHTRAGWTRFARWNSARLQEVLEWGDGLLIAPFTFWAKDGSEHVYGLGVLHKGNGHVTPMSTKLAPSTPFWNAYASPVRGIARAGSTLFVAAEHGTKLAVERKGNGVDVVDDIETLEPHDVEVERCTAHLWAASPALAVVFGEANGSALFQRFDGHAWTRGPLPSGITGIVAYDRTSDGKERFFASDFSLYERSVDGPMTAESWVPVPMPTIDPDDEIQGVWLVNDDAWLLVWGNALRSASRRPARLMRLKPVKHVWSPDDAPPP